MAPELCAKDLYDNKVDVWATGVLTYAMMTGRAPFNGKSKEEIYKAVIENEPNLLRLEGISAAGIEFIRACL